MKRPLVIIAVGTCLFAAVTACKKKEETATAPAPPAAVVVTPPGSPEVIQKGKDVFTAKCSACHAVKGVGGKVGPDLSDVGARRDAVYIQTQMQNPKAYNPNSTMPSFADMPKGDQDALVAYLLTLK
jgi:mono/diheme cytochrome c family protein